MIKLTIDTKNLSGLLAKLAQAKRDLTEAKTIEKTVKTVVAQANEANILTQGQRIGATYPKLTPEYARQKQRRNQGNKILVATGALLQSVKEESRLKLSSNKTNRGYQITVFTDNEIARFAENPPKRRRIFGLNSRDLRTILNAIENQFLDNLKG